MTARRGARAGRTWRLSPLQRQRQRERALRRKTARPDWKARATRASHPFAAELPDSFDGLHPADGLGGWDAIMETYEAMEDAAILAELAADTAPEFSGDW